MTFFLSILLLFFSSGLSLIVTATCQPFCPKFLSVIATLLSKSNSCAAVDMLFHLFLCVDVMDQVEAYRGNEDIKQENSFEIGKKTHSII